MAHRMEEISAELQEIRQDNSRYGLSDGRVTRGQQLVWEIETISAELRQRFPIGSRAAHKVHSIGGRVETVTGTVTEHSTGGRYAILATESHGRLSVPLYRLETADDPTGVCPNCGRRQGWDGHPYAPCDTRSLGAAQHDSHDLSAFDA